MVDLQARLTADTQNFQSGSYVNWTLSNGTVAPATNTTGHPLQFSVNLQNQTVPTFYNSSWPQFTPVSVCSLLAVLWVTTCPSLTGILTESLCSQAACNTSQMQGCDCSMKALWTCTATIVYMFLPTSDTMCQGFDTHVCPCSARVVNVAQLHGIDAVHLDFTFYGIVCRAPFRSILH